MSELNEEFWTSRYLEGKTGWDLGTVSPPIKAYFDQVEDKNVKVLIPGCGNAYEAEYLHKEGFKNIHVVDLSKEPLDNLLRRVPTFRRDHVHQINFFELQGVFDIIVEQTMFCAIDPILRREYAHKAADLLRPGGKLIGVMFSCEFDGGPPYGGSKEEYLTYFEPYFSGVEMTPCYNSIAPRMGNELFVKLTK